MPSRLNFSLSFFLFNFFSLPVVSQQLTGFFVEHHLHEENGRGKKVAKIHHENKKGLVHNACLMRMFGKVVAIYPRSSL